MTLISRLRSFLQEQSDPEPPGSRAGFASA